MVVVDDGMMAHHRVSYTDVVSSMNYTLASSRRPFHTPFFFFNFVRGSRSIHLRFLFSLSSSSFLGVRHRTTVAQIYIFSRQQTASIETIETIFHYLASSQCLPTVMFLPPRSEIAEQQKQQQIMLCDHHHNNNDKKPTIITKL